MTLAPSITAAALTVKAAPVEATRAAPGESAKSPVTLEEPFVTARDPPSLTLIPSALFTLSTVIGEAMVIVLLPGKSGTTTSSDAAGSLSPDQLAAVLHCPSPASPSQVATASIARDSRCSTTCHPILLRRDRAALRRLLAQAAYRTTTGQVMRTGWNRAQHQKNIRIMHLVDLPPQRRARRGGSVDLAGLSAAALVGVPQGECGTRETVVGGNVAFVR